MIDRLVWIDLEMTGLDPDRDVVLEIAALVTDSELVELDEGIDLVIAQPEAALETMADVVRDMHARSGLTDAVRTSTVTLADAEAAVLDFVRRHVPEPKQAPLCGNSISTDRSFLVKHMPSLDAWMHYRIVDVSSIKELARRWHPEAYNKSPQKAGGHRALADIRESIEELRYYRRTLFVPPKPKEIREPVVERADDAPPVVGDAPPAVLDGRAVAAAPDAPVAPAAPSDG